MNVIFRPSCRNQFALLIPENAAEVLVQPWFQILGDDRFPIFRAVDEMKVKTPK